MKRVTLLSGAAALLIGIAFGELLAQEPPGPRPFGVGNPLGLPVEPATDRPFEGISSNVKVYGAIYSAESCSYDPERGVIVVPNRGVPQTVQVYNACDDHRLRWTIHQVLHLRLREVNEHPTNTG